MSGSREQFLVSFTCSSTRHPGVGRFVWIDDVWVFTGASRQRPGSTIPDTDTVQTRHGRFGRSPDYPGCPSCGSDSYVRCGRCSELGCWDETWPGFLCPTCGNNGPVSTGLDAVSSLTRS
jgi:hypothetical protein